MNKTLPKEKGFTFARKEAGFTLIELLVTITIIVILAGIITTSAAAALRNARDAQRKKDLKTVQSGLQQYYADQGFYPDTGFDLNSAGNITNCTTNSSCVGSRTYLSAIPKDPTSGSTYCYNAYNNTSRAACSDTPASANRCFYYSLYANLETGATPSLSCKSKNYNLEINPS